MVYPMVNLIFTFSNFHRLKDKDFEHKFSAEYPQVNTNRKTSLIEPAYTRLYKVILFVLTIWMCDKVMVQLFIC